MKHNYRFARGGVSIRPAELEDSEFIIELRNHPSQSKYLGTFDVTLEQQAEWMRKYYKNSTDYYFIIELRSEPVGTIGVYNLKIGDFGTEAEFGRWVVLPEANIGTVAASLLFYFVFDVLKINFLYWQTVSENIKVVKFHDLYAKRISNKNSTVVINGVKPAMVFHGLTHEDWKLAKPRLTYLTEMALARC